MTTHSTTEIDRLAEQRELARVRLDRALIDVRKFSDELCRIDYEIKRCENENNEPRKGGL